MNLDRLASTALALPEAVEDETSRGRCWKVRDRMFAWERPFTKADLKRFGDAPVPPGPIVGLRCGDLGEKEAVLAAGHAGVFTIPHFDGYAAVLVDLPAARLPVVRELVADAWLAMAPPALAATLRRAPSP